MAIKEVVLVPDPILKKKASKVAEVDKEVQKIVTDLIDTLNAATDPEGTGIAAPQIGIPLRVCIARRFINDPNIQDKVLIKDYVLINPEITNMSDQEDIAWEGCLSVPDVYGKVSRAKRIKVTAWDEKGETVKIKATGFFARVIQHEVDHLNGILFTEKLVGKPVSEEELDKILQQGR